jgi:hypothetical protein
MWIRREPQLPSAFLAQGNLSVKNRISSPIEPWAICGDGVLSSGSYFMLGSTLSQEPLPQRGGSSGFSRDRCAPVFVLKLAPKTNAGSDNGSGDYQPFAICRKRKGLSTVGAIIAAMMFRTAAITKTAVQLPVADINTLPSGTSSAAVPLAVYNKP